MFWLGTETTEYIYKKQKIHKSNFAAKWGMYFHTKEKGIFFMDRGRFQKTYPFTIVSRVI